MNIFNTLTGKKERLLKPKRGPLKFFVCGPTVYDYIHIGNARTYVVFDTLVRYLRAIGFRVFYLQNITDIDDKIIKCAEESGGNLKQFAKKFEKAYLADEKALGIRSVTKHARATNYITDIVKQVQVLIKRGYAYKIPEDGYYFDITKFKNYGKLSRRTALQAEDSVTRIDESVHKRNKGDFTLWKFYKAGEPFWKTSLGKGRPGWHIEDTAITERHFGPQYDIHGGGIDLKFPHHEAELAQQESASQKTPFVKIWMHSGFLNFKGSKMSKSAGRVVTVREFLKENSSNIFRYLVLSHHYRYPINYSEDLVVQAKNTLNGIEKIIAKLKISRKIISRAGIDKNLRVANGAFHDAMSDDFNTPEALSAIFSFINYLEKIIFELDGSSAKKASDFIINFLKILGLELSLPKIPVKVRNLAEKRDLLRGSKQFVKADDLRKEIDALGYSVEDTPLGSFIWPQKTSK